MYIYIYIGSAFARKPLYRSYIHIYGLYKPNPSLAYIYMGAIYMFSAFIWMLICIMSFAYTNLGMLQACCPISLLPPMRRVALDSMQKNSLNTTIQGRSSLATCLDKLFAWTWVLSIVYMGIYACKHLIFALTCPKYDLIVLIKCAQHCQLRTNNTLTGVFVLNNTCDKLFVW